MATFGGGPDDANRLDFSQPSVSPPEGRDRFSLPDQSRYPPPAMRNMNPASTPDPANSGQWVEIEFDCLPLRSVTRTDIPVDASPAYEQFVLKVKAALEKHGAHNAYYLSHGSCRFHLTNEPLRGMVRYAVEGVLLTDLEDQKTIACDLHIRLIEETCSWLNEPIVEFLAESVRQAMMVEFDRYILAGDLEKTRLRIAKMQADADAQGGFIGMYL